MTTLKNSKVYYQMLMPASEMSEILFFKEKNITDFFKAFNDLYNDYEINKKNRIVKVSRYYKRNVYKYIQSLSEFQSAEQAEKYGIYSVINQANLIQLKLHFMQDHID